MPESQIYPNEIVKIEKSFNTDHNKEMLHIFNQKNTINFWCDNLSKIKYDRYYKGYIKGNNLHIIDSITGQNF